MASVTKTPKAPEVIALKSVKKDDKATEVATITLFSIDGKDYSIPTEIRPNKALQVMHVIRTRGESSGISFMLETLLGTEGYEALLGFEDLKDEDLEKVIKIAFELVAGATEGPKA